MKRYRRKEIVEAIQWKRCMGINQPSFVQGTDDTKLCGCVIIGGPYNKPHIHETDNIFTGWILNNRDWIVITGDGKRMVMTNEEFVDIYEDIKN